MSENNSSRRYTELAQYVLGALSLVLVEVYQILYILLAAFVVGGYLEGIRITQIPNLLGFLVSMILKLAGHEYASHCSLGLGLILSVTLRFIYGNSDFTSYPQTPEAPFKSGYKVIRTSKYGNEVHVYYPIDKNTEITKEKDAKWLAHGEKTIKGLIMLAFHKVIPE